MKDPVQYTPDVEDIAPNERETIDELNATLDTILERVAEDEGHAYRAVHAKSHGLVEAKLTVPDNLAAEYAQGIFARPGTHEAILRLSTNPGDLLDDSVAVPRGLALKVLNVEGERLDGAPDSASQDFVMLNGPAFSAPNAEEFLKSLKLLAATTDRAQWAKKAWSKVLQGVEKTLEATTGPSATVQTMGGAPNTQPLGETYYTQTPLRFGNYVAKLQLAPVSDGLTELTGKEIDAAGRPNALREEVDAVLRKHPAKWELRAQLWRDPDAQPVEDATAVWDEQISPFSTVAIVEAQPQPGWAEDRAKAVDDHMFFSPWNAIQAHQPLGSVNRARRATYEHSAKFRERWNRCPIHEPDSASLTV